MAQRDRSVDWNDLPDAVRKGLDTWLEGTVYELSHRGWFPAGRSGSPVGLVERSEEAARTRFLIMKFCSRDGAEKARAFQRAWNHSPEAFRAAHLVQSENAIPVGGWWLIFQQVAGGDLSEFRPLSEFWGKSGRLARYTRVVVESLLEDWNRGNNMRPASSTVDGFLRGILKNRIDPDGPIITNAHELGVDTNAVEEFIQLPAWRNERHNPFGLLANPRLSEMKVESVLLGRAHGDLNGRNILIPSGPSGRPEEYFLIDFDRFDIAEPLARDPMHLLVSFAIDLLRDGEVTMNQRNELIDLIVDPRTADSGCSLGEFKEVSEAIHSVYRDVLTATGGGHIGILHNLLSLVAAALMHVGRDLGTRDVSIDRAWCLELAAAATDRYLKISFRPDAYAPKRTASNDLESAIVTSPRYREEIGPYRPPRIQPASSSGTHLVIDDVHISQREESILFDVRIRNSGKQAVNLTRAGLRIIDRDRFLTVFAPSATYDLTVDGDYSEFAVSHFIKPDEIDRFLIEVGFSTDEIGCVFTGELILWFNGREQVVSGTLNFSSIF